MISPTRSGILAGAGSDKQKQMAAAAVQFEQLFANMMMKSMRSSVPENSLVPQSTGEKIYTEMLDSEYADLMVKRSSLGLAATILRQMGGGENSDEILSTLSDLKRPDYSELSQGYNTGAVSESSSAIDQLKSDTPLSTGLLQVQQSQGISSVSTESDSLAIFTPKVRQWEKIIDKASAKYVVEREPIAAGITT